MATIDLVGQCAAEINHTYAVTITDLEVRKATPTTVKKGAHGAIGTAQGIPDYTASFTLAVPQSGLEFNLETLAVQPGGFTLSYPLGIEKYALAGMKLSEDALTVNNAQGDVSIRVSATATDRVRLA